jgi:hypothetical protein
VGAVPASWVGAASQGAATISRVASEAKGLSDAAANEETRRRRLRKDARRPLSVNLAETIALSHELLRLAGATKRS